MHYPRNTAFRPAGILLVLTAVLFSGSYCLAAPPGPEGPPPKVQTAAVQTRDVVPAKEYVGHVEAIQFVDILARVEGFLTSVEFKEGQVVSAGSILYTLEQDQYKAQVAANEAKVKQDEAELTRTGQLLQRLRSARPESVSATDLDNAVAAELSAKAKLAESEANLTLSRLNLDYTTIHSPIAGRIGRTAFTQGNLVSPSSGFLARIVQVDPIRVVYSVSENDIPAIQSALNDSEEAEGKRLLAPQLRLADGVMYKGSGQVDFVDNQVDPATGTVAVRARFDNKDGILMPGQYVTVLVKKSEPKIMPVVPQSAVLTSQEGRSVLVVDDENRVTPRQIITGPAIETMWAVESGLKPGEQIIVQGIQKVKPGQVVEPVPLTE